MAQIKKSRGVDDNQILEKNEDWRDPRSSWKKLKDGMEKPENVTILAVMFLGLMFYASMFTEVIFVVAMLTFYKISKIEFSLPFRLPKTSGLYDPTMPEMNPKAKSPYKKAEGIMFLGNEISTRKELWLNSDDARTHILVFGSTGAGKALRMSEDIHTPNGWVKNKNIKLGDLVTMPDGSISNVIGVYPQGEKLLYRMIFEDERFIDITADHLWEVVYLEENNISKVIPTIEVQDIINKGIKIAVKSVKNIEQKTVFVNEKIENIVHENVLNIINNKKINSNMDLLIEGDLNQRTNLFKEYKNMLKNYDDFYKDHHIFSMFGFSNIEDTKKIQKLAYSLGYWAKIEEVIENSENSIGWNKEIKYILIVKSSEYLIIKNVIKTKIYEECQCIKIADRSGLFITKDYITTHNTETLISLAFNTLVQGSGFIYVDGKGDSSLWSKIFAIARSMGRDDDVLVLNYMTGGRDVAGAQESKMSNTLNPLISGSSGGLTELIVGLMGSNGGGDDMWKGRAISLISAVMRALVWLRDYDGLLLDVDKLRNYLILENIQELAKRTDLPSSTVGALKAYLLSIPGYVEGSAEVSETAVEQHGYLQMQFTRVLGSLSDDYGYIFRTNLGEIDFMDVIVNRRILCVLLPALEKSIDELANLGKIVVACLKSMMGKGLGDQLEGNRERIIERKVTAGKAPCMVILDEYGYYVVRGAAVMPAQARSLGFSMVFAGQDYPAFQKNDNKEEAISTIGNCNIKIFMKVEDPTETFDLFAKSVGEANVLKSKSREKKEGMVTTGTKDGSGMTVERVSRGDLLDLKDQGPGEAHIIFKSTLVRASMFYANPKQADELQLNHFIKVEPAEKEDIESYDSTLKQLTSKLSNKQYMMELEVEDMKEIDFMAAMIEEMKLRTDSERNIFASVISANYQLNYSDAENFKEQSMKAHENYNTARRSQTEEIETVSIFAEEYNDDENYDDSDYDELSILDLDDEQEPLFFNKESLKKRMESIDKYSDDSDELREVKNEQALKDFERVTEYPNTQRPQPEDKYPTDIISTIDNILQDLDEK